MAEISFLASTALMAIALGAIAAALSRWGAPRRYEVQLGASASTGGTAGAVSRRLAAASRSVWTVGFLALVVLATAGVAVFLGEPSTRASLGPPVVAALGAIAVAYLVAGVYRGLRLRGRTRSEAVAVAAWTFGLVFLVAMATNLLV